MTSRWLSLAALILPGGSLIVLALYLRRRWLQREAETIKGLIAGNAAPKSKDKHDDSLRVKAEERRRRADMVNRASRRIATGDRPSSADQLRRIK